MVAGPVPPPDARSRTPTERSPAILDGRKAGEGRAGPGTVTDTVLDAPPRPASAKPERRTGPRRRARLRSGKVLDADGRFLTECVFYDVSPTGGRIRPPAGTALPDDVHLYDDRTGLLHRASVLWRNGHDVGVRFRPLPPSARMRAIALTMRRKFYAVTR